MFNDVSLFLLRKFNDVDVNVTIEKMKKIPHDKILLATVSHILCALDSTYFKVFFNNNVIQIRLNGLKNPVLNDTKMEVVREI